LVGAEQRQKPNALVRLAFAAIVLLLVWWVASKVMSFFDNSIGRKAGTTLELRTQDGVQVSLQGEDWQRGESSLKLYAGDAVATRGAGDAVLHLFDGTRVRLDVGTDLLITTTDKQEEAASAISLELRSGRIWISTPSPSVFSGAIVRSIHTTNFDAEVPAATNAIISSSLVNVLRASGVGVKAAMTFGTNPVIYIGEGQYFSLTEQAKRAIEEGQDAYDFRDPVTLELLKDAFLVSSLTMQSSMPSVSGTTSSGTTASAPAPSDEQPIVLSSPADRAQVNAKTVTVSGRVSAAVVRLTINGQAITLKADRSFSVDVALSKDPTTTLSIQAEDAQGIPLSSIQRTVTNAYKPVVAPPRIKSPVGSGETLNTSLTEVEITGEAAPETAGIIVNDYRLQLFKPGGKTWSYLASTALGNLKSGENIFTVYAIDADGNKSDPRSITIVVEGTGTSTGTGSTASQPPIKQNPPIEPGTLTVDAPVAGTSMETDQKEIVIEGRTSAMTNSISVNGYTLSLYKAGKTTWNYIASVDLETMKRGRNVYRVVSRNADGEILDVLEYVITFKP
jgi:hypothetical protein